MHSEQYTCTKSNRARKRATSDFLLTKIKINAFYSQTDEYRPSHHTWKPVNFDRDFSDNIFGWHRTDS